jgi:uncharacterized membrane protein
VTLYEFVERRWQAWIQSWFHHVLITPVGGVRDIQMNAFLLRSRNLKAGLRPISDRVTSEPMNPVAQIGLWTGLFVGSHFLLSCEPVRGRLVVIVGTQPFRGVYSLVALGTFIPMLIAFGHHKHAGPTLWYLRGDVVARGLTWGLMFIALILLAAGLLNPNPAAIGAPSRNRPAGILKLTRHPSFVAFILFGVGHVLMNGWTGDVIFFGGFVVLGILGGIHQDRRKLRELGAAYSEFLAATSFFPGAALLSGRNGLIETHHGPV